MIVEPYEMRMMGRELESAEFDVANTKLLDLHEKARSTDNNHVIIPKYWAPTVLGHVEHMLKEFPQLKFGSIFEHENKLKIYTIPTHRPLERLKVDLYNDIDTLVLKTIDRLSKGDTKPVFMR